MKLDVYIKQAITSLYIILKYKESLTGYQKTLIKRTLFEIGELKND